MPTCSVGSKRWGSVEMKTETQVLLGLGLFFGLVVLILLRRLLLRVVKLLLRTAAGAGVLALLAQTGGALGIQLGVNLYNALVLGVLGVPGFGLLLLLRWFIRSG